MPEKSVAVVRPHHLLAMLPFMSSEETRYYLRGVFITPHPEGGAVLVATTGHMLLCIHDPSAFVTGPPQIWRFREILQVVKSLVRSTLKERKTIATMKDWIVYEVPELDGISRSSVCFAEAEEASSLAQGFPRGSHCIPCVGGTAINGSFPDWTRVFPHIDDVPRATASSFQPQYLKQMGDAAVVLGCDTMTFAPGPSDPKQKSVSPAVFSFGKFKDDLDSRAVGLIMPMRTDDDLENYPYWLQAATRGFGSSNVFEQKEAA